MGSSISPISIPFITNRKYTLTCFFVILFLSQSILQYPSSTTILVHPPHPDLRLTRKEDCFFRLNLPTSLINGRNKNNQNKLIHLKIDLVPSSGKEKKRKSYAACLLFFAFLFQPPPTFTLTHPHIHDKLRFLYEQGKPRSQA